MLCCSHAFIANKPIINKLALFGALESDIILETPPSIQQMMIDVAKSMLEWKNSTVVQSSTAGFINIPLPVTGGTDLDDWPGGILQKYSVLRPMIQETLGYLKFQKNAIDERKYLGYSGEEDAVGLWEDCGYKIVCHITPDTLDYIRSMSNWRDNSEALICINPQLFLDPLSKQESIDFVAGANDIYLLESLNMRGPNALPCRGLLYRAFPDKYKAARRLDGGGYVVIAEYDKKPIRSQLEEIFLEDSKIRDKDLSLADRAKRYIPSF